MRISLGHVPKAKVMLSRYDQKEKPRESKSVLPARPKHRKPFPRHSRPNIFVLNCTTARTRNLSCCQKTSTSRFLSTLTRSHDICLTTRCRKPNRFHRV